CDISQRGIAQVWGEIIAEAAFVFKSQRSAGGDQLHERIQRVYGVFAAPHGYGGTVISNERTKVAADLILQHFIGEDVDRLDRIEYDCRCCSHAHVTGRRQAGGCEVESIGSRERAWDQ